MVKVVVDLPADTPERVLRLAAAVDEARALNLVILNVSKLTPVCSYFVICHGRSPVHAEAIAEKAREQAKAAGIRLHHREGSRRGEWIILDYMDVVVHIFSEEAREFYNLERLWGDARRVNWVAAETAPDQTAAGVENDEPVATSEPT